ncbi:hypothetical protein NFI96_013196 [Prochilodus magdalenae]|nr:hypothetical protein NFI96_013196 [Prochilodus magdalenae]
MTKKKAKAKKHKREKKRSPTPPCEERARRKDHRDSPGSPKERQKHVRVSRRRSTDNPRSSTEDSPKKEPYKKSDVKSKQAVFRCKVSQTSDHRALPGIVKHSFLGPSVSSTGKSSSTQSPSRPCHVASSKELEEQRKSLVKRRSSSVEPRYRAPKVATLPEKKSKLAKRRSSPEEDRPCIKRRTTTQQVEVGPKLREQKKKLVDHISREAAKEVAKGKSGCHAERESKHSIDAPSSVKYTKATQHASPKTQDDDRQRGQFHSTRRPITGQEPSSRPFPPVVFKIPKKPAVVKEWTDTDVWDNSKTSAAAKKPSTLVSTSSPAAKQNKQRPAEVSTQVPLCTESHKTFSLPQVQPVQSRAVGERSSPCKTPTQHPACPGTSAEQPGSFDNNQEMQLVEELHLARSDKRLQVNVVESYGELTCMDVDLPEESTTVAHSQEQHQQDLLIVLDTNVLLSHLDFVKKMRSHGLGALGFPTLLVPWVVLQELDSLKSGKLSREVEHKARPAVHYIYSCLKNQEPRLCGQSMQQASQASYGLSVVNNDDRVLHCCLQYQSLYPEGTLILCTNDKNLCSKALLSGVSALSKADLVKEAERNPGRLNRNYAQRTAHAAAGLTTEEHGRKPCEEEEQANRRNAAWAERELSECVSVLESNLQSVLSEVLEEEMKAAYGELWTEIVYLKPPWTLEAVLQCFRKHWIAVFGNIIKRNLLGCVETLSSCLCSDASVERSSVLTALYVAEELLRAFNSRSQYSGHMPAGLSCLQTLRHRLQGQPRKSLVEDTSDGDTLMAEPVEEATPPPQTSSNEVWAFFESLWNNVCHVRTTRWSYVVRGANKIIRSADTCLEQFIVQEFSCCVFAVTFELSSVLSTTVLTRLDGDRAAFLHTPTSGRSDLPPRAIHCSHTAAGGLPKVHKSHYNEWCAVTHKCNVLVYLTQVLSVDSSVEDTQALLTIIQTCKIAAVEPRFTAKDLFECLSQREYRRNPVHCTQIHAC